MTPRPDIAPGARMPGSSPRAVGAPRRPVWVGGTLGADVSLGPALAELAARARVPLLADPMSGARLGDAAIAHYDLLLRVPRLRSELAPDLIVRVGDLPTSKPLRAWLAGLGCAQVSLAADDAWSDPDATLSGRAVGPLRGLLQEIAGEHATLASDDWLERWRAADRAVAEALAPTLAGPELSEPAVAAQLSRELPEEATLFVASSMPVRDLETFAPVRARPLRVLANRGANGIDGIVSSAFGAAAVSRGPLVLLIGDVALAHDLGGLLSARRCALALTIVLLNNDGGGIFHFLPVAGERDAFEEHVGTPHGLAFEHAAALYGCGYERARDVEGLRGALRRSLAHQGTSLIEVRTERQANLELHRALEEDVRAALGDHRPRSDSELERRAGGEHQHRAARAPQL